MDIVITGRHTEASERFRQTVVDKLAKVEQLAPAARRVDVELSHEPNPRQSQVCKKVEITVRDRGPVIRAEACAEDPYSALDLALGKLAERLRRVRDRRKVHHGRHNPATVRQGQVVAEPAGPPAVPGSARNGTAVLEEDGPGDVQVPGEGDSPVVIRTKEHQAAPMTLDQALYEMELVGHDFFLFVDATSSRPSVVYRRHGWNYGVIQLEVQPTGS